MEPVAPPISLGRHDGGAWGALAREVVGGGLCTGCAGCVLACPWHVLRLDQVAWVPRLDAVARTEPGRCVHEERGCTLCARACPRWGDWEEQGDLAAFGHSRTDEDLGVVRGMWLVWAADPAIAALGQDGGVATAVLAYALEAGLIDAALVSYAGEGQRPRPGIARSRDELLAAAGSRYTYSANSLALAGAGAHGAERLGLVTVGCQASIPAVARARKVPVLARRFALVLGLLCSRTFTDDLFTDLVEPRLGVPRDRVTRVNIKGRLQVWTGAEKGCPPFGEIPLRDCDPYERPGCRCCPDFTAAHADLSLGGVGREGGRTFTIVRSERGERLLDDMHRAGLLGRVPAEEDPAAIGLVRRMAARQRLRWPPSVPPGRG